MSDQVSHNAFRSLSCRLDEYAHFFQSKAELSNSRCSEISEFGQFILLFCAGLASPCGECRGSAEETGVEFAALAQNCSRRLVIRVAHNPSLSKIDADAFKDVGMCSVR
jgi:hypothetical protein